jgi:hypothetical protein|tara:strand:+ start:123 stop:596 length:474 start_codon:yes stop_codon:yes gene_type:complete
MTKWARMRRRKERRRAEEALQSQPEGKEPEPIQPEKISKNTQETEQLKHDKSDAKSVVNEFDFSKSNTILAQIPRYVYLVVIFSLLSGVFFPLITPGVPFDSVIQGTLALFLGLVGGILLFKTVTSDNRRGIFITVGFSLITISLVLIFWIQEESIF